MGPTFGKAGNLFDVPFPAATLALMAKLTRGPGWAIRTDDQGRPLTKPPRLPLTARSRGELVRAIGERSRADPRELFEQRVEWRRWWIYLRFGEIGGRIECIGVEVMGNPDLPDQAPVTALALRSLPFGKLVDRARRAYREALAAAAGEESEGAGWSPGLTPAEREEIARRVRDDVGHRLALAEQDAGANRTGRPSLYSPEHFARVAEVYTAAWRAGGNPTEEVARRFGTSRSAAAKWVARTRAMGLLLPTTKGKAGGLAPPARKGRRRVRGGRAPRS
jgi:hypothetical protein